MIVTIVTLRRADGGETWVGAFEGRLAQGQQDQVANVLELQSEGARGADVVGFQAVDAEPWDDACVAALPVRTVRGGARAERLLVEAFPDGTYEGGFGR